VKHASARIATTHLDKQGEMFALSALESIVEHIAKAYLPMGVGHDPRIAPIGRVVSASVVRLTDEEYAVDGELEIFGPDEVVPLGDKDREITAGRFPHDAVIINSDYQFRNPEDQADVRALADIYGTVPGYEAKKAADPLAVLTLTIGKFVVGAIAVGYLARFGEDLHEASKSVLKRIFGRRNTLPEETLLRVIAAVQREGMPAYEIEIISSRPTDEVIDALLGADLALIDRALDEVIEPSTDIRRIVFEEHNGEISVSFAIRLDAVPLFPHLRAKGDQQRVVFEPQGRDNRVRLRLTDKQDERAPRPKEVRRTKAKRKVRSGKDDKGDHKRR
jgi:hypothetical protein